MKSIVILPTYNEAANIVPMAKEILAQVPGIHILIVDDNSPDGTGDLADSLSQKLSDCIFVIHRKKKEGLGKAYLAGFQYCIYKGYERIVQMDADFSHPIPCLPKMLMQLDFHDFVLGSRYVPGGGTLNWGFIRRFISKAGNFYAKFLLNQPIKDLTGGFKAYNIKVIKFLLNCHIQSEGYSFQIETTFRALNKGFTCKEIPIIFKDRKLGKSKMSKKIIWEALIKTYKLKNVKRSMFDRSPPHSTSIPKNY